MSKLSEFISTIKDGLARPAQFAISITKPNGLYLDAFHGDTRNIVLLCDSTRLPGMQYQYSDIRTTGEVFKVPYEKLYGEIGFDFYMDQHMKVKLFFDNWMELIQTSDYRISAWPDKYKTIIEIYTFDKSGDIRYKVKLFEAYPYTVFPIDLNYANKDIMRLQTIFLYRRYEVELVTSSSSLKVIPFDFFKVPNNPFDNPFV